MLMFDAVTHARRTKVAQRRGGGREASAAGAHQIVRGLEPVDADRRGVQPAAFMLAASAGVMPRPPVVMVGRMPARGERRDDVEEARVQVGLAADEHDLAGAGRGELLDDLQRSVGGQLVGARVAGARAAVGARLIARERQLPDHVGGVQRCVLRHLQPAQCHAFQIALDRDRRLPSFT